MRTEALLAVEVDMGLNGVCKIQMDVFHKSARPVRADRENAERKGAKAFTLPHEVW